MTNRDQPSAMRQDASMRLARPRASSASERGSSLVETALSIVIFMTVLFGVIEISLAAYTYHFLSEAAREGTRYAIVRGNTCIGFSSACPASTTDIQTYVKGLGFPGIDPNKMTVTVTYAGFPVGVKCSPSTSCNNAGNTVKILVKYAFPFSVPFVPANTFNMSSTSQMVIAN